MREGRDFELEEKKREKIEKKEREREYFNGKREKLYKIYIHIYFSFGVIVHSYRWLCIVVEEVKFLPTAPPLQNGYFLVYTKDTR